MKNMRKILLLGIISVLMAISLCLGGCFIPYERGHDRGRDGGYGHERREGPRDEGDRRGERDERMDRRGDRESEGDRR